MSEKHYIEHLHYIPETPKMLNRQELYVYLPTAGTSTAGISRYDENHFVVSDDGLVSLKKNTRHIIDITTDVTTGKATVKYDDGTTSEIVLPVQTTEKYLRSTLLTTCEFTTTSWVTNENVEYYCILFSPTQTGYNKSDFFVSLEEKVDETYVTVVDSVVKGSDGTVMIYVDDVGKIFNGRILLLAGHIFTDANIAAINYDSRTDILELTYSDNTNTYVNFASKKYVDDEINDRVSTLFIFGGQLSSSVILSLTPNSSNVGNVFTVTDDFITDNRFVEGPYVEVKAGSNVAIVKRDDEYRFNVLGWYINFDNYSDRIRNGVGMNAIYQTSSHGAIAGGSVALGIGNMAATPGQCVVGRYAESNGDYMFEVGDGEYANPETIFGVRKGCLSGSNSAGFKYNILSDSLTSDTNYYLPSVQGPAVFAISADVDKKLDKYTGSFDTEVPKVYAVVPGNINVVYDMAYDGVATSSSILMLDIHGNFKISNIVLDSHAVNKAYVDSKFLKIRKLI